MVVMIIERKMSFTVLTPVDEKSAAAITVAIMDLLVLFKTVVLTISADIDKEYVYYKETIESSQCNVYFADYYFSWQRRLHENTNGLLR